MLCRNALDKKSIDEVLQLIPSKKLLNQIAPKAGCKDGMAFARAITKHINIEDIIQIKELKEMLNR